MEANGAQKDVPLSYKFQRWLLLYFPKDAIITINNSNKTLEKNFLSIFQSMFFKKKYIGLIKS